jgi:light-regulated signal transduction histidine kinase (bacteriophytochrome)
VKAATALISVLCAFAIWPTIPKALAAPGISNLRLANQRMAAVVAERNAELTAVTRELDAFASSIAHDLRTPLRSINGFALTLSEEHGDQLGAPGKEMVDRIGTATLRMSRLMDDLLTMSRLTRAPIRKKRVDISAMAASIADSFRRLEPERQVACAIAPGIEVSCDPDMMHTALTHLLGNAWKFTGRQPCPEIELGHRRQNGEDVLYVRDNGVGFDMAYAEKLFVPFQRLHRPEEFPGNGIGLAIIARIVHRHGGDVSVETSLGKGTTVTLTIP